MRVARDDPKSAICSCYQKVAYRVWSAYRGREPIPDRSNPQDMMSMLDLQSEKLAELCRRTRATRLDVFGSAVRDDFDPATSDIDFLVEFEDLPPARYAEAYFSLKESLESLFGRPVDLVTPASLENPYFRHRVLTERKLVYAR